jgi:predicted Rossmann fold nucleotide-binding protein DprA/Smf involved in DNA uptake
MILSPDSQAILLLCSHLGIKGEERKPLTLKDWNPLAQKIWKSPLKSPGALLGLGALDIKKDLDCTDEESERIAQLLEWGGGLAVELERLESLGIGVITRADENYPSRFRQRLKEGAPTVLFYAGEKELLGQPGIAVVGSRALDQTGVTCAELVGNACAFSGKVLYSGGAKGVDSISTKTALENNGYAVSILADSLERSIRLPDLRKSLISGSLCLVTPYAPDAGFSVGTAMGRNRMIKTLSDYAIVVSSDYEKGGTWAGASETLKAAWVPVFILKYETMREGNQHLLEKGGLPLPFPLPVDPRKLYDWLSANSLEHAGIKDISQQLKLEL